MLQPTGLLAMQRMGLRDAIEALGHRITQLHGMTGSGRTIFNLDYNGLGLDHYALGVHRAALHGVLWDAFQASGVTLLTGQEVVSVDHPVLAGADLIIDASGARSVLRGVVTNKARAVPLRRCMGLGAGHRHSPVDPRATCINCARHGSGYLPVGSRDAGGPPLAALFWSLRDDQYEPWRLRFDAWRDEARALWPVLAPVLDALTGPDDLQHATYLHFDAGRAWRDNLELTGDAAHATSPQLGQGANQALIDAVVLTDALSVAGDLPEACALYARTRRAHVRFYQYASWMMTPFFQSDSRSLGWMRDMMFNPMKRVPRGCSITKCCGRWRAVKMAVEDEDLPGSASATEIVIRLARPLNLSGSTEGSAMAIDIRPLTPEIAGDVSGVDLTQPRCPPLTWPRWRPG